jgi:hypothetical protein
VDVEIVLDQNNGLGAREVDIGQFFQHLKLIKISAKVVSHGRYIAFQMAEVAIPRQMFQEILRLIVELRPQLPPAPA